MRGGRGIEVHCYDGRSDRYRAVAKCSNGLGFHWESWGNVAWLGETSSYAECNSLLGDPHVTRYYVRWG